MAPPWHDPRPPFVLQHMGPHSEAWDNQSGVSAGGPLDLDSVVPPTTSIVRGYYRQAQGQLTPADTGREIPEGPGQGSSTSGVSREEFERNFPPALSDKTISSSNKAEISEETTESESTEEGRIPLLTNR